MTPYLKHFGDSEIILNADQAAAVLKFYFPAAAPSAGDLSRDDIGFAQGLLLAGIDSSYEMRFAEILFRTVGKYVPPTFSDIKEIAKEFGKARHTARVQACYWQGPTNPADLRIDQKLDHIELQEYVGHTASDG